ncbi:MAG: hypothetical protein D3924_17560 [Candidatus Electrothrix sp. AR4]|nr:hypothetical protein [Candidatus Electrothrix sp. AR4]
MVTISFFFWTFVVIFGMIGAIRGWGKELLVSFSIVLALFVMQVALAYIGPVRRLWDSWDGSTTRFYVASLVVIMFAFFGYHTPKNPNVTVKSASDRLQNMMLGVCLGAVNGYLLVGTLWYFLDQANYPFPEWVMIPPEPGTPAGDAALKIIHWLPPVWLDVPVIYFAVAIAFTFVVIVLI